MLVADILDIWCMVYLSGFTRSCCKDAIVAPVA